MPTLTDDQKLKRKHAAIVDEADELSLLSMAAKRLLTDFKNGNLTIVRLQLEDIGGAHSRAAVGLILAMLKSPVELDQMLKLLLSAARAAPRMSVRRQKALRNLALLHLDENEP